MVMAEGKDTYTPEHKEDPTRRVHILRVVVAVLLASLIAFSIPAVFFTGEHIDNRAVLWGIRTVAILVAIGALWRLIRIGYAYQWTGLGDAELPKQDNVEFRPKKTLWDWLQLLIVPIVLASAGFWFTMQQEDRQQRIEDQRARAEQQLEEQRAQDTRLQAYLDQMSVLMLDRKLLETEPGDPVHTLAQARTFTVIASLDAEHNRSVTRFLTDSKLTGKGESSVALLKGIRVRHASLSGAFLSGADLSDDYPDHAELFEADLKGADLEGADLTQALLPWADLSYTFLDEADLGEADLG